MEKNRRDNYSISFLMDEKLWHWRRQFPLIAAWTIGLFAMLGSLFFSEVMRLPPCSLCWYQRIALFPLVAILATGILCHDTKVSRYACPFVVLGFGIALYHNLLEYDLISESLAPCSQGVSCKSQPIQWLGFVTIPLLSLLAFIAIGSLLFLSHTTRTNK